MRDLTNPRWMYAKAVLLLLGGVLACAILLVEHWSWRNAVVLAIAIWCFCRAYYFAFYVIQHYVDPSLPVYWADRLCPLYTSSSRSAERK